MGAIRPSDCDRFRSTTYLIKIPCITIYCLSPIFFRLSTTSVKYFLCKRKILDYATNDKKLSSKVINWCIRENCSISFKAHTMSNQNIFLASATLLLFAVSCNAFKISTRDYCPPKPATMAPFDAARVRIQEYFSVYFLLFPYPKNFSQFFSSHWKNRNRRKSNLLP